MGEVIQFPHRKSWISHPVRNVPETIPQDLLNAWLSDRIHQSDERYSDEPAQTIMADMAGNPIPSIGGKKFYDLTLLDHLERILHSLSLIEKSLEER